MVDHDLPLGVIGSFRPDHPLIRKLDDDAVKASTAAGTPASCSTPAPSTRS